jgi:cytosine/adenosine deaminase-related metal-dependent hydrolase
MEPRFRGFDVIRVRARDLLPVNAPPVRDGAAVLVRDGVVVAVGRDRDVPTAGARTIDLGDAVVLPGLINAHAHLELSWMADTPPRGDDWAAWVADLVRRRTQEDPVRARRAADGAMHAVCARGTVAIGDVANGDAAIDALIGSGLHGVIFREVFRLRDDDVDPALDRLDADLERIDRRLAATGGRLRASPSPHAPHTTAPRLVRGLVARARSRGVPFTVHAAESPAEVRWLADGGGPLAAFYRDRGLHDPGWSPPGVSPIEALDRLGAIGPDTLLVHAVHLADGDVDRIRERGATVVTCPRSNRRLRVGRAPVETLLRAGVPVALGTDSLASTPDLDPFAELAALREDHPGLAPGDAIRIATGNGARALGLGETFGAIAPGRRAALVAVHPATPGDDPEETVTSGPVSVAALSEVPA